ncbi:MAG: periplasmic heavy metal sensor [Magnetococcales bacterium]|nr:periplasmic heavy metal sensor [Magnetococcales bacterium]
MNPDNQKRLIWILFISLVTNLFLAGLLAGKYWPQTPPPPMSGMEGRMMGGGMGKGGVPAMSEQAWAKHGREIHESMQGVKRARQRVTDQLSSPQWDEKEVQRALAQLRESSQQVQALWHQALVETAAQLPPESRATLLQPNHGHQGRGMGRR